MPSYADVVGSRHSNKRETAIYVYMYICVYMYIFHFLCFFTHRHQSGWFLPSLGLSDSDVERMLRDIDVNKDGRVSIHEFVNRLQVL